MHGDVEHFGLFPIPLKSRKNPVYRKLQLKVEDGKFVNAFEVKYTALSRAIHNYQCDKFFEPYL